MKNLWLCSVLLLVFPVLVFADFQFGPVMQYKVPISAESQVPGKDTVSINDFSFGADARLNMSFLQLTTYALYNPGDSSHNMPGSAKLYLDGGICVDIAIVRLGVGLGPNFIVNFHPSSITSQVNGNIRFAADLMLGDVALSAVYLVEANLTKAGIHEAFRDIHGQLGLSLLFKLF